MHLRNTNVPRDYAPDVIADIADTYEGAPCPTCGTPVRIVRGVEVGNTFKLGTRYSHALGATFLDESGKAQDIVMGSYGIGVGRLIACVAEECRDERGLIWPITLAPFHVYLVGLDLDDAAVSSAAEDLYDLLRSGGVEVLYDDRKERAGVKFNDADLLGIPVRLTVSRRTVGQGSAELKLRTSQEARTIPLGDVAAEVRGEIERLEAEVLSALGPEPLPAG